MSETVEKPPEVDPAVEAKASEMGWSPKDKWRGDPEKWVDAATFVKRGEEVLPILRHNNQQLLAKTGELQRALDEEKESRKVIEKQLKDLAEFQAAEVERQVKERTKELRKQIRAAREAGNEELEDQLTEELDEVRTKPKAAPAPPAPAAPAPAAPDPAYVAWAAANKDWWELDIERTSLAIGIATRLRRENAALQGADFFREVDKRLEKFLQPVAAPSKVEGGGGGGGSSGGGTGYADLPADAKAVCNEQASRFVGANKLFKDAKEWQAHYAKVYFASQGPRA